MNDGSAWGVWETHEGVILAVPGTKVSRSSWDADMDLEIGSRTGHLNCRHGIQSMD